VTSVRVRERWKGIGTMVTNLVLAFRGASAVNVDIGHSGAGRSACRRPSAIGVYDAVILKTLGATRARLLGATAGIPDNRLCEPRSLA